jgi:hypothetical protein
MALSSGEIGRTVGRKFTGSCKKAWKVGSEADADFQGFLPVARLRRIIARDHMSLNIGEYDPVGTKPPP